MIGVIRSRGWRWAVIGVLAIGIPWAIWQRWQISQLDRPSEERAGGKALPKMSADEVIAKINRAFGSDDRPEMIELAASRLLRDRSDAELEAMLSGLETKFGDRDYDLALAVLRERATRDINAALDLGLATDKQYVNDLIHSYSIADPEGARRWLERTQAKYPGWDMRSFEFVIERHAVVSERLSDPIAALSRTLADLDSNSSAAEWDQFTDNIGPEHWKPFVQLAMGTEGRHYQLGQARRTVAKSMIARLGFDGAWEAMGELGLSGDTADDFAEVLATVELGDETPARMARLLERLPETRHPLAIRGAAADWVEFDEAATRQWLLSFPKETRKALLRHTNLSSVGLREEDVN